MIFKMTILSLTALTVVGKTVYFLGTKKPEQQVILQKNDSLKSSVVIKDTLKTQTHGSTDTLKVKEISGCYTYDCAYKQYVDMLEGRKPIDFKKAVFIYENTYLKGTLHYNEFLKYFSDLAKQLKDYINKKGIAAYKTSGQYAIFSYMYEPSYLNNNQVFKYDFNDFMGDKNWENMFVTKAMKTKTGNCHSLPYYYKIIANELNLETFLAIAPNHMYIKHIDENGKWVNIELTNGHPSSDAWMISSMGISAEAIKKGIYMDALSEKENVALCLWDLAMGYQKDNGYDEFVLKCCNTVIKHYPTCISAIMTKFNCLLIIGKQQQEEAKKKGIGKTPKMKETYEEVITLDKQIKELGYREMPQDLYEQWVKSVEQEKQNE